MPSKQVIVMRKDLKMRRGKEIAQGGHATCSFLVRMLQVMENDWNENCEINAPSTYFSKAEWEWCSSLFKKVTVQVNSEDELVQIYIAAKKANLQAHLITDSGLTEFNGVPTKTCCAIGPDEESKIDPITGHLSLY